MPGGGIGGIAITPNGKTVYVITTTNGGIARINLLTGVVLALPGVSSDGYIALAPNGRRVYLGDQNNSIYPFNIAPGAQGKRVSVPNKGLGLSGIAIAPDGNTAYVASYNNDGNTASGALTPINLAAGTAMKPILVPASGGPYGGGLYGIAITSDGHTAYVAGRSTPSGSSTSAPSSFLASVNLSSGSVGGVITLPSNYGCIGFALVPNSSTPYVACDSFNSGGQIGSSVIAPVDFTTKTIGKPIQLPGVDVTGIAMAPAQDDHLPTVGRSSTTTTRPSGGSALGKPAPSGGAANGDSRPCSTSGLFAIVAQKAPGSDPTDVPVAPGYPVTAFCSSQWAVLKDFTVQAGSGLGLAVFQRSGDGWRLFMMGATSGGGPGYDACKQYPASALEALGAHLCSD